MTKQEYFKLARELQAVAKRWGDRCNSDAGPTVRDVLGECRDALAIMNDPDAGDARRLECARTALKAVLNNVGGGFTAREATEIVRAALNGGNVLEAIARGMPDEQTTPPATA